MMNIKYFLLLVCLLGLSGCDFLKGLIDDVEPLCKGEDQCCVIETGNGSPTGFCATRQECIDDLKNYPQWRGFPKMTFPAKHATVGSDSCYTTKK
ncbi:hypothetical protein HX773_11595 [Pantoea sp. B9002]|uniref:hypothetical protein n=1 Tax=Pantoea sp. B9002 TaxID=2726979 RepID=UPI0015A3F09A|nr:hypothetical protein [Pantoea sp. B9002]NWA61529.1 hypothetical protein [Pantoea sp. B9002]